MPTELKLLAAAAILGVVQLLWAAGASRKQQGLKWAAGPRDEPRPVTGVAARLNRAFANYRETFPLFAAAVLAATVGDKLGDLTHWGSWAYLVARVAYVPLYAAGIPRIRSLVWFVSLIGLAMVLAAVFV